MLRHEYTEANAKFALSVDPDNKALQARTAEAHQQRAAGQPTIPSVLGDEKRANPFLLAKDAAALADVRGEGSLLRSRFPAAIDPENLVRTNLTLICCGVRREASTS